jgi:hypothetical protein
MLDRADRAYLASGRFTGNTLIIPRLHCGIVLRAEEDACQVLAGGQMTSVRYASQFPAPRRERVLPGHLVAVAEVPGEPCVVVWRWYDAVVLGGGAGFVRLWEPVHGEIVAQPRRPGQRHDPGTRAYLSAGLPGAACRVVGGWQSCGPGRGRRRRTERSRAPLHRAWDVGISLQLMKRGQDGESAVLATARTHTRRRLPCPEGICSGQHALRSRRNAGHRYGRGQAGCVGCGDYLGNSAAPVGRCKPPCLQVLCFKCFDDPVCRDVRVEDEQRRGVRRQLRGFPGEEPA